MVAQPLGLGYRWRYPINVKLYCKATAFVRFDLGKLKFSLFSCFTATAAIASCCWIGTILSRNFQVFELPLWLACFSLSLAFTITALGNAWQSFGKLSLIAYPAAVAAIFSGKLAVVTLLLAITIGIAIETMLLKRITKHSTTARDGDLQDG